MRPREQCPYTLYSIPAYRKNRSNTVILCYRITMVSPCRIKGNTNEMWEIHTNKNSHFQICSYNVSVHNGIKVIAKICITFYLFKSYAFYIRCIISSRSTLLQSWNFGYRKESISSFQFYPALTYLFSSEDIKNLFDQSFDENSLSLSWKKLGPDRESRVAFTGCAIAGATVDFWWWEFKLDLESRG